MLDKSIHSDNPYLTFAKAMHGGDGNQSMLVEMLE